jgi:hypothetical protein
VKNGAATLSVLFWGAYDLAVPLIVVPLALPRSVEDDERDDVS